MSQNKKQAITDPASVDYQIIPHTTDVSSAIYTSFSGADIKCAIYIPPQYVDPGFGAQADYMFSSGGALKIFAELQTITISSARTIDPVRVLGSAAPVGWTRGARTVAGSMIFTDIIRDAFANVLVKGRNDSGSKYEFFVDQMPPFNIIITALNEYGMQATRALIGITLVNYGTTYSIDDLITESTYSYVARTVTPFMPSGVWRQKVREYVELGGVDYKNYLKASALQAPVNLTSNAATAVKPFMRRD